MIKKEYNNLIKWAESLSDSDLEKEYYNAVYDCLGSEAEIMEEQGWDDVDVKERRKFEKWLGEKADLLEKLCDEREIKLWENKV